MAGRIAGKANGKKPRDLFARYLRLPQPRSLAELARRHGLHPQTVRLAAAKERWLERAADVDGVRQHRLDNEAAETIAQMDARHVGACRKMHAKCVAALEALPLESAAEALKGLADSIKLERLIRGEPTERHEIAALVKREAEMFLRVIPQAELLPAPDGERAFPEVTEGAQ